MRDVASALRLGVPAVVILTGDLETLAADTARAMGMDPSACAITVPSSLFGLSRTAIARRASIAGREALVRLGMPPSTVRALDNLPVV